MDYPGPPAPRSRRRTLCVRWDTLARRATAAGLGRVGLDVRSAGVLRVQAPTLFPPYLRIGPLAAELCDAGHWIVRRA